MCNKSRKKRQQETHAGQKLLLQAWRSMQKKTRKHKAKRGTKGTSTPQPVPVNLKRAVWPEHEKQGTERAILGRNSSCIHAETCRESMRKEAKMNLNPPDDPDEYEKRCLARA